MLKRLTTVEFVDKARKVHGDKYDYSLVEYTNSRIKVKIICSEHGIFEQKPVVHLSGRGCRRCAGTLKLTTEEFIEKARKVHGNKYDYSLVDYKNNHTKVKIICSKHGVFNQTPNAHLNGDDCYNCPGKRSLTTETFIEKARKVHGDRYDYMLIDYKKLKYKIKIVCPVHGIFEQNPSDHLQGSGCSKCNGGYKLTIDEFIEKSRKVHGNKYDYSQVEYKNKDIKVKIICRKHGIFEQIPSNHIRGGNGCPICSREKCKSKNEIYCFETLKKMYPWLKFKSSDREVLKGKSLFGNDLEIDIKVQDQYYQDVLYIEWNGIYWHRKYSKNYDELKKQLLGDKLLQIVDDRGFDKFFVESVIREKIVPRLGPPRDYDSEDISCYFK